LIRWKVQEIKYVELVHFTVKEFLLAIDIEEQTSSPPNLLLFRRMGFLGGLLPRFSKCICTHLNGGLFMLATILKR
jgi:hypothetical protein